MGTNTVKDVLGMGPTGDMLMRRLDSRRISAFTQFDTSGSSISAFSTAWRAFIEGVLEGASLVEEHRINTILTKCSTHTIWFDIFLIGVEMQVGIKLRTYQAINI